VSAQTLITTERLLSSLRLLCGQPSHAGHSADLVATSEIVVSLLRGLQMEVVVVSTPTAPLIIARRNGRSPTTLLLYHHYDVAPPGPWRAWSHEPYQIAERDNALYGRGVAHGKGPFVAHCEAIYSLLQAEGELPCGVVFVVEGSALQGSPGLDMVVREKQDLLAASFCLAVAGDCDAQGRPFCYSGTKGRLQVRLHTHGPAYPLVSGLAASVRNPIWRMVSALASIKGDDEDIKIANFYESVEGPTREENNLLRKISLDEKGRLETWQLKEFMFGMSKAALIRAEVTLPTCNLVSLVTEPGGELPTLPSSASALLEFHLVPNQQPAHVFNLLREHLIARGFEDVVLEPFAGGYPPVRTAPDEPWLDRLATAGAPKNAPNPLTILPAGPFTLPLHFFADTLHIPVGVLGLAGYTNATRGPDERIMVDDLLQHSQALIELMSKV
jgi:acetylornithine deacetylase/succinyl-diaminopimelate desuccinylase-like protein